MESRFPLKWAYAVTTTASRLNSLLPKTLASLVLAGFDAPRLFVDGTSEVPSLLRNYEISCRVPTIRTFGNWILGLAELYIRQPEMDRYAMFQDDLVTYKNLRAYLEKCDFPETGYWNLYTMPSNDQMVPLDLTVRREPIVGWHPSNQMGRGAVGLVFNRTGVQTLLTNSHIVERPVDVYRGHRAIDGGIVTAFKKAGWKEYIHHPSLVQHTGVVSSMDNNPQPFAESFRGEEFDALELVKG